MQNRRTRRRRAAHLQARKNRVHAADIRRPIQIHSAVFAVRRSGKMKHRQLASALPRAQAEREVADRFLDRVELRLHAGAGIDQQAPREARSSR